METLRFLMVSTYYPPLTLGGDAYFVKYLSEELAKKGHEVHVFYSPGAYDLMRPGRTPVGDAEGGRIVRHGHSFRHPKLEILSSLAFGHGQNSVRGFETVRRSVKPDIVHWHNTRGFIGEPIPTNGATNLLTAHDYYMICPRANLLRPNMSACDKARRCSLCSIRWKRPPQTWRLGNRRVLRPHRDVSVISPSEFLAAKLRNEGISVPWVLGNFVPDVGARTSDSARDTAKDMIVYLGMLEVHKGVMTLVQAFINTKDQQGFTLALVGDGTLRKRLENLAMIPALGNRLQVKGFIPRDELDHILSEATMQIIPSEWYENAPLVALEALCRGIPVLSSDMGGLPEIMTPTSGSMLFAGGDGQDLEKKLVMAWNQRDEMPAQGLKAREEYEKRHTPTAHMRAYSRIINRPICE